MRTTLDALYRSHKSAVARFASALGGSQADVDDLVQEVFVVAGARLSSFRGDADIRTWLYAITRNVVRHRRRGAHRALRRTAELRELTPIEGPTPEDLVAKSERARAIAGALENLDEKYRTTLLLHAVDGLSGREIAARTGVEPSTVWVRIHRARALLKEALLRGAMILFILGAGAAIAHALVEQVAARKVSALAATNAPMKHKPARFKNIAAAAGLACAVAAAVPAIAAEEDEREPDKVVYSKKTIVEFSEIKLSGEVTRPAESYLLVRRKTHFLPYLKIRTDFRPELIRSVDDL